MMGPPGVGGGNQPGELQKVVVHDNLIVRPGQAIIWSVGPDRFDNGGLLAQMNHWIKGVGDLISIVPLPAKPPVKKP